ncbi:MAG TPA: hypothetical protein VIL54_12015 [Natronosporangium sp.]|jgi:hypothetical protein
MSDTRYDRIVDEWLSALEQAAAHLPPDRRRELVADLREHIAVARAELRPETEAGVRTILDRLGDPDVIVAEARDDHPGPPPAATASGAPGAAGTPRAAPDRVSPDAGGGRSRTVRWVVVAVAVVAVCVVGCLAGALGLFAAVRTEGSHTVVDTVPGPYLRDLRPTPVETPGR